MKVKKGERREKKALFECTCLFKRKKKRKGKLFLFVSFLKKKRKKEEEDQVLKTLSFLFASKMVEDLRFGKGQHW